MNYLGHYRQLIDNARARIIDDYVELHHILPRCMGGDNSQENLVALTPEEHYIAHILLVKIYPDHKGLIYAANMMANRNNKTYGWVRRKFIQTLSEDKKGFKHSDNAKQKMSEFHSGRKKSKTHKNKISESHKQEIEYNGVIYNGYAHLTEVTGITYHLYRKYYVNGIDPRPYINNRSHGMVNAVKKNPPKASLGKRWYNNGIECKYFVPGSQPINWKLGRLK